MRHVPTIFIPLPTILKLFNCFPKSTDMLADFLTCPSEGNNTSLEGHLWGASRHHLNISDMEYLYDIQSEYMGVSEELNPSLSMEPQVSPHTSFFKPHIPINNSCTFMVHLALQGESIFIGSTFGLRKPVLMEGLWPIAHNL
jgi:hypothetical protein